MCGYNVYTVVSFISYGCLNHYIHNVDKSQEIKDVCAKR